MTITKTRIIDQEAQKIFNIQISPAWLVREQKPDIYVDYFVELGEESKSPSGIIFGVQLKGVKKPRYSREYVTLSFKTRHLKYYLDKMKQPIFVVLIDVTKKIGYWLFVQEWLKRKYSDDSWCIKKKIDLKIPIANVLGNANKLLEAVKMADRFMHNLWPGSIPAAVDFEKKRLEKLDPRFGICISHSERETAYIVHPKEDVELTLCLRNDEEIKKSFQKLIDFGTEFVLNDDKVTIKGSKLFDEFLNDHEKSSLLIQPQNKPEALIEISTIDRNAIRSTILCGIKGNFVWGDKGLSFSGSLPESPFNISLIIPNFELKTGFKFNISLKFETQKWENISVAMLPYFDKLFSFFSDLSNDHRIEIQCEAKGNQLFLAESSFIFDDDYMKSIHSFLVTLKKMRTISKHFRKDLLLPSLESMTRDDQIYIDIIYGLLENGEHTIPGVRFKAKAQIIPSDYFFATLDNMSQKIQSVRFTGPNASYQVWGEGIEVGPVEYTIDKAKVLTDFNTLKKNKVYYRSHPIQVEVVGELDSQVKITQKNL